MTPNTDAIHQMCSDIPVSAEDAAGLQEAAERIKRGHEELSRDLIEQARSEAVGG